MASMKKWVAATVAVLLVALGATGGAVLHAQAQGKPAQSKEEMAKKRAERIAIFKKAFPTAKTSLATALATAEKEGKGRVHSIEYTLTKDNKLTIEARLVADDKFVGMYVDPDTGKASAAKADEDEEEEEEEEGGK